MNKGIIDQLTVLAESYEDAELDSCKPTAGVLRQAVARIAELETEVTRQKELRKQADEQRIRSDEERRSAVKIARNTYYQELQARIAELEKDKARLDWLIKIMSTDNGDYFCFEPDGDGWSLTLNDDISMSSVSVGRSQIEAIDAAIAKEQEHE